VQVTFILIDHEILSTVIHTVTQGLCSGIDNSYQFLAKMKATSTGKLLDSLPRNNAATELCSGKSSVVYCHDPEQKLPTLYT
jgi:hypothetical protein